MIPIPITRPLAGILDACREAGRPLSQRDLGRLRSPRVSQAAVGDALRQGEDIKLSTLAAYARATGHTLRLGAIANDGELPSTLDACSLDVSVSGARDVLRALGLRMTLALETI